MPTRTHYITASGQPPNGGVPPGVAFLGRPASENMPPPAYNPTSVVAPPPPGFSYLTGYPAPLIAYAPPPPPAPAPAPDPAPTFEPPGARLNGGAFVHEGRAYLFPAEHTIIHFFHAGDRPFENPQPAGAPPFMALHVATTSTVADLMRQLGVPQDVDGAGDRFGVTECIEVGDGSWTKGTSFILSQDRSKKTLKDLKWEGERPVWLAPFDAEKHHL